MDIIQQLNNNDINEKINNKIKIAFEKINYLINIYKQNNEDYYHKIIKEIYQIYENENNNNNNINNQIDDDNKEKKNDEEEKSKID